MSELPSTNPENREVLDDNARKFTLETLAPAFLAENQAKSFVLTTDWLKTDDDSEEKLARKEFKNGDVQRLRIMKTTKNGKRTSVKEKITEEEYQELIADSVLRVEKVRHEFTSQDGFSMKYDEFLGSDLRILEVDATNENDRDSFSPIDFPTPLTEVTGNMDYQGYRVAGVLASLES